ncbi:hypothetical protein HDV05_003837 [Chytridiales sp. JEL 0842]|nr:hypothetical protein HDV05_003837 [Chytridiales sp. JEL 0842]
MKYYIQLLPHPTPHTPPPILIHFDSARYLINVPEGTQRGVTDGRGLRLGGSGKLQNVFLTRGGVGPSSASSTTTSLGNQMNPLNAWATVGGLPGMILTLADQGLKKMDVHGGVGTRHLLASMRGFLYRPGFHVGVREVESSESVWKDGNLEVRGVLLRPDGVDEEVGGLGGESRKRKDSESVDEGTGMSREEWEGAILNRMFGSTAERGNGKDKGKGNKEKEGESRNDGKRRKKEDKGDYHQDLPPWETSAENGSSNNSTSPPSNTNKPTATNTPASSRPNPFIPRVVAASSVPKPPSPVNPAFFSLSQLPSGNSQETSQHPLTNSSKPTLREISRMLHIPLPAFSPTTIKSHHSTVISYVFRGPTVLGKMDPEKALKLGVPKGPLFGKLSRGESVTLPCGKVVESKECVGPSKPGAVWIVIDCPSTAYINSLTTSKHLQPSEYPLGVKLIIHCVGPGEILSHEKYQAWMRSFGDECQHIVCGEEYVPATISLHSSAGIQTDLSLLDGDVFPPPYAESTPKMDLTKVDGLPTKMETSKPLLMYQFEPAPKLIHENIPTPFQPRPLTDPKLKLYAPLVPEVRERVKGLGYPNNVRERGWEVENGDCLVVPLGTGAAIPGKYRNVSSTLALFEDCGILMDAGEGTLGQIYRHFGVETDAILQKIRVFFVSHLHADHHLGLVSILARLRELGQQHQQEKTVLVGPGRYLAFLREVGVSQDLGLESLTMIESERLGYMRTYSTTNKYLNVEQPGEKILKEVFEGRWLKSVVVVQVRHCPFAYAAVFEHASGVKVAFSGDCRPSDLFAEAARGADLVLHEATLADEMMQEAVEKNHCTTSEAVGVARKMKAKNLLLTHFSQRYPKLPKLDKGYKLSSEGEDGPKIGIAFDSMRIRLSEFGRLGELWGPLGELWKEVEMDEEVVEV